jgi:hypothetical protein
VAIGAAAVVHFDCELIAVRVVVAVDATLCPELQVVAGPFALVTAGAADRLMLAVQWKLCATVLLDGEQRRPEPVFVVAFPAVGGSEPASMDVAMAVGALLKLQTAVPPVHWELGRVTAFARDVPMQTLQGKGRLRMRAQPDLLRQPDPANAGMAVLTSVSELRVVYLRVAGNAVRTGTGNCHVSFIVAGLALRLGVTPGEAQTGVVLPNVGDFAPIGFVVAGEAFGPRKRAFVGILMTGHALGLQPEKRCMAAPVPAVVAVLTSNRSMCALERPARLAMIKPVAPAARPADEPRIPTKVLDVTSTAFLPAILPSVQARLLPYLSAQVIVTPKARVRIEPSAGRVALAAIGIAIDVGVITGELSRGQKLGAARVRRQRSGNRNRYHQAAHDRQSGDAPPHSEKIQRYP